MGRVGMIGWDAGYRTADMWNREVGALAPRAFSHRAASSLNLVLRLGIHQTLDKHRGCVNTVTFNETGNILVSGSDDRMIILWDWEAGLLKHSFHSGHMNNVFHAKFMPFAGDKTMATCGADGEVRVAQFGDGVRVVTRMLARHEGRAHKIVPEPGNPHILYSCGEDGLVNQFDLRCQDATKLFKCKTFKDKSSYMPIVQLHAIAIDPNNPHRFAIAGSDEYARVYDIRKCRRDGKPCGDPLDCFCPSHLIGDKQVGITGLAFSTQSELLTSYTFELIYLFAKDQGLGADPYSTTTSSSEDQSAGSEIREVYTGHQNCATVKGVSFFGPSCEYVTSGSDCGRVFIWRKMGGELLRVMEGDKNVVNCIEANPFATMLASCGIEKNVKIWLPNIKKPVSPPNIDEVMKHEVRFFSGDDLEDEDESDDDNLVDFLDIDVWSIDGLSDDANSDDDDGDDDDDNDNDDAVDDDCNI